MSKEKLIGKHGGYARLKSFQVAQLVYDVTVRFCERYIDRFSRTRDQMVQAARSGVQNIAEGSQASATSKKTEIKLTQVARASLEELKLDYEDFLRQRDLPQWGRDDPLRQALVDRRCRTAEAVAAWIVERAKEQSGPSGQHGPTGPSGYGEGSTKSTAWAWGRACATCTPRRTGSWTGCSSPRSWSMSGEVNTRPPSCWASPGRPFA